MRHFVTTPGPGANDKIAMFNYFGIYGSHCMLAFIVALRFAKVLHIYWRFCDYEKAVLFKLDHFRLWAD